ncbi:MAG: class I SAM-dependent methyltransferase, partial [Thermodesulfovibrionales bacterium]|nr:class I SAM-dependent methyltransferase [Thermodesulfovibrionales bacterium]
FNIITNLKDKDMMVFMLKTFFVRLRKEGYQEDALRLSIRLYDYCSIDKEIILIIGVVNYDSKIYEVAERFLRGYVDLGGVDRHAFYYLAEIAHQVRKDSKLAYDYYLKAIGISDEHDKVVYHRLGLECFALGNYEDAIRYFQLAGDYKLKHIEGYFTEGLSHFMLAQYDDAYKCMDKVIKVFGSYPPAEFMLKHSSTLDIAIRLRGFIGYKEDKSEMTKRLGSFLRPYASELQNKILCRRNQIWQSTNFYNDLDGLILYALINMLKPKNIIEFSPFRGYSTVFIYEALRKVSDDFTFATFDLCECTEFTEMMRLFDIDLKVKCGDAISTVPQYIKENDLIGKIDLCHIDSMHEYDFAKDYIEKILPLLGDNCVIAIHDMYFLPDSIDEPFDFYEPISYLNICPNPASIGEARAVREYFKERDDYVLFSTHRLFGGFGHCAPPLPLNKALIECIGIKPNFLEDTGYWTQSPMLLIAIPKKMYENLAL